MDSGADNYRRFREDGDESGLADIIREYQGGLILYLNSFVGDMTVAEELAEDTFVLLGTKKPRDTRKGSFKTWLYTIGRHIAIDYLRRHARRREISLDDCRDCNIQAADLETRYIRQEDYRRIHRAMAGLKTEYRQVLWLVYFEEFSHKQVAMVMKKRVHAVDMLVSRAKKALKMRLETEGYGYENN